MAIDIGIGRKKQTTYTPRQQRQRQPSEYRYTRYVLPSIRRWMIKSNTLVRRFPYWRYSLPSNSYIYSQRIHLDFRVIIFFDKVHILEEKSMHTLIFMIKMPNFHAIFTRRNIRSFTIKTKHFKFTPNLTLRQRSTGMREISNLMMINHTSTESISKYPVDADKVYEIRIAKLHTSGLVSFTRKTKHGSSPNLTLR